MKSLQHHGSGSTYWEEIEIYGNDNNLVSLGGYLTRNPELRHTLNGQFIDMFLAVYRHYHSEEEKTSEVTVVNVIAQGKLAEACINYLIKGSAVVIEGTLRQNIWEKDGQKGSGVEVMADQVEFFGTGITKKTDWKRKKNQPGERSAVEVMANKVEFFFGHDHIEDQLEKEEERGRKRQKPKMMKC